MESRLGALGARMQKLGGSLSSFGSSWSRRVSLPLAAAGVAAVKLASDAEETANKVGVTFGQMADDIEAWSNTSIRDMGLARATAQDMASTFGLLFQAAKLPRDEVVGLSKDFTQLSVDMASFFNVPIDQALGDLRSGLVGETEPLRKYGVLLSEANVQQEAVRIGLVKANEELSEQEKVIARASLIQGSLTKAQGDFARTQDSVANQTRTAVEELKEMGAELGVELLPLAKDFIAVGRDIVGFFSEMSPGAREATLKIAALAIALGPVTRGLGGLLTIGGKAIGFFTRLGSSAASAGSAATTAATATSTVATSAQSAGHAFAAGVGRALAFGGALALVGIAADKVAGFMDDLGGFANETDRRLRLGIGTMEGWNRAAQENISLLEHPISGLLTRDAIENGTEAFAAFRKELEGMTQSGRLALAQQAVAGLGAEFRKGEISFEVYQHGLENIQDTYLLIFPAGERLINQQERLIDQLGRFADEVIGSNDITDRQRRTLEDLIPAYRGLGVEIDGTTLAMVEANLANGHYETGIQILERAIADGLGPVLRRYGDQLSDTERRQIEAAIQAGNLKRAMDLLSKAIKEIPDKKKVDVEVDAARARSIVNELERDLERLGSRTYTPTVGVQLHNVGALLRLLGRQEGGIVAAQHGGITRGPTILAGEGRAQTPFGTGTEAIVPFDARGIGILAEAITIAMGRLGLGERGGPSRIAIGLDRRRFARGLDHEFDARGW